MQITDGERMQGQSIEPTTFDMSKMWSNYFPGLEFSEDNRRFKLMTELAHFFSSPSAQNLISQVSHFHVSCQIDPLDDFAHFVTAMCYYCCSDQVEIAIAGKVFDEMRV